jgi:hypothetical protein
MKETHISVEVFKKAYLVAIQPVATPTIMSYNASAVKNYNATSSVVRFENTIIFFYFEKTL